MDTTFDPAALRALTFDVFGTVVDWRTSVIREGRRFGDRHGLEVDWTAFADAWRGLYQPAMHEVREGRRSWVPLDVLHRESLGTLAGRFGFRATVRDEDLDDLNLAWHRLDPWPDAVPGLDRLKGRYLLATLSNGNVSLMTDLAEFGRLPLDALLGAEPTRSYKPMEEAYLGTARLLGCRPGQCMLVAAHNQDLHAASALGFRTAFVHRPREYGPDQATDLAPDARWDVVADGLDDLAEQLLGGH